MDSNTTYSVLKDIWNSMESKEPWIVYEPNMDLNVDFIRQKIIEEKGLWVHTREMHVWVKNLELLRDGGP